MPHPVPRSTPHRAAGRRRTVDVDAQLIVCEVECLPAVASVSSLACSGFQFGVLDTAPDGFLSRDEGYAAREIVRERVADLPRSLRCVAPDREGAGTCGRHAGSDLSVSRAEFPAWLACELSAQSPQCREALCQA